MPESARLEQVAKRLGVSVQRFRLHGGLAWWDGMTPLAQEITVRIFRSRVRQCDVDRRRRELMREHRREKAARTAQRAFERRYWREMYAIQVMARKQPAPRVPKLKPIKPIGEISAGAKDVKRVQRMMALTQKLRRIA